MDSKNNVQHTGSRFPETRHTALRALKEGSSDARKLALDVITAAYRPAVYNYLRLRWSRNPETAADLTQSFFLSVLEHDYFCKYDPDRARFRTFIRVCLDRHVAKADRAAARQKRGGGAEHLSLDFVGIEDEIGRGTANSQSPEDFFKKEWMRTLLSSSINQLESHATRKNKSTQLRIFKDYDIEPTDSSERPTYKELADQYRISVQDVTNYLAAMRREFRRIVLERLREMTANEAEFRAEVREVLGVDP